MCKELETLIADQTSQMHIDIEFEEKKCRDVTTAADSLCRKRKRDK